MLNLPEVLDRLVVAFESSRSLLCAMAAATARYADAISKVGSCSTLNDTERAIKHFSADASCELTGVHVDRRERKAVPFPEAVRDAALANIAAAG